MAGFYTQSICDLLARVGKPSPYGFGYTFVCGDLGRVKEIFPQSIIFGGAPVQQNKFIKIYCITARSLEEAIATTIAGLVAFGRAHRMGRFASDHYIIQRYEKWSDLLGQAACEALDLPELKAHIVGITISHIPTCSKTIIAQCGDVFYVADYIFS